MLLYYTASREARGGFCAVAATRERERKISMIRTVHVIVAGRVQGVGYRAWVAQEAETRRLSGWVRNRHHGSVEAMFSGEAIAVDTMIAACEVGPRMAWIENVTVADSLADGDLRGFRILATA
jgi:acylphosphatase